MARAAERRLRSRAGAQALSDAAPLHASGARAPCYIKVDCGLGRLGVRADEAEEFVARDLQVVRLDDGLVDFLHEQAVAGLLLERGGVARDEAAAAGLRLDQALRYINLGWVQICLLHIVP